MCAKALIGTNYLGPVLNTDTFQCFARQLKIMASWAGMYKKPVFFEQERKKNHGKTGCSVQYMPAHNLDKCQPSSSVNQPVLTNKMLFSITRTALLEN